MISFFASPRNSRIASTLVVLCSLGLSACGKTPKAGMMLDHPPTPPAGDNGKKIYASPVPEPAKPEVTPNPGKPPAPAPSHGPYIYPNPTPSARPNQPWNPFPGWPNLGPSTKPSPTPSTEPNSSVWPSMKPSPKPSPRPIVPTVPVIIPPTSVHNDEIEVPTNLLTIYTRTYGQAFGVYDDGRLEKPDSMPLLGQGFQKVFQERDRGYGSLDILSVVQAAAKEIHRELPATEVVQIGDISDKNGGQLGGHASHQNGLDADIVYFKKNHKLMPITGSSPGATGFDEDFVDKKGAVTANFDVDANWRMIQIMVGTGRIDRIFADQHIKRAFCEYAVAKGMREEWKDTLRKLRHWPNHQDHMHVRLTCPPNSKKCKVIPDLPQGDGCGSLLDLTGAGRGGIIRMDGELLDPNEYGDPDEHGC